MTRRNTLRLGGTALAILIAGCNRDGTAPQSPTPPQTSNSTRTRTETPISIHSPESTETATPPPAADSLPVYWQFNTGAPIDGHAVTEASVYVVSDRLYALNRDGSSRWQYEYAHSLSDTGASVFVGKDVYLLLQKQTPFDRVITAIRRDGTRRWVFDPAAGSLSMLAVDDDTLYAATMPDEQTVKGEPLFAIDATTGEPRWQGDIGSFSFAVIGAQTLYVSSPKRVRAFESTTGTRRWETPIDDDVRQLTVTQITGVTEDTVYVEGNAVHALSRTDGAVRWKYAGNPPDLTYGTLLTGDGLYVGVARQEATTTGIAALDPETGQERWMTGHYDRILRPAAATDETVYGRAAGVVTAIDAETGAERWTWSPVDQENVHAIGIAGDTVFVWTSDRLYGLGRGGVERWRSTLEFSRPTTVGATAFARAENGVFYALHG